MERAGNKVVDEAEVVCTVTLADQQLERQWQEADWPNRRRRSFVLALSMMIVTSVVVAGATTVSARIAGLSAVGILLLFAVLQLRWIAFHGACALLTMGGACLGALGALGYGPGSNAFIWFFLLLVNAVSRPLPGTRSCLLVTSITCVTYLVVLTFAGSWTTHQLVFSYLLHLATVPVYWMAAVHISELERMQYLQTRQMTDDKLCRIELDNQNQELRREVHELTLRHHHVADFSTHSQELPEFTTPVEEAMSRLQRLSSESVLPQKVFIEIQKVIVLIGNSSDIFRVHVADQLADNMDEEMNRYLFDIVNRYSDTCDVDEDDAVAEEPIESVAAPSPRHHKSNSSLSPLQRMQTMRTVVSREDMQISEVLAKLEDVDFDAFEVARVTKDRPLFFVGLALFTKYRLIQKFNIDIHRLRSFLTAVEQGYSRDIPYHNSLHGADVARSVHYFLHQGRRFFSTDLEILSIVVASLVHDIDHPGKNNVFYVNSRDTRAIMYNDKAVLENHHVAYTYTLLQRSENNIFHNLTAAQYVQSRKIIIDMVLSTDLGNHFDFVAQFKNSMSGGNLELTEEKLGGPSAAAHANRLMAFRMAIKCSDLGHTTKTFPLHHTWTKRIEEEFFQQGDAERALNLPISPFMDRQNPNLPNSQTGFFEYIVWPMYSAWAKFLGWDETKAPMMVQLYSNRDYWKSQQPPKTEDDRDRAPKRQSNSKFLASNKRRSNDNSSAKRSTRSNT